MIRLRQLVKGIIALLATFALVVGVPAVLAGYIGWPLPTRLPTLDEIQLALRSGIDPQLLVNTLAVIVWIIWTQLVVALTVEFAAVARGKAASRVPVLPGMQVAAARLVATVTLVAASLGPLRTPAAGALPLSDLIVETTYHTQILRPADLSSGHRLDSTTDALVVTQPAYQVQRFDTLWRIAETTLGDGQRWPEIRDLNLGHPTSDGQIITNTTERIAAGTRLLLPADATLSDQTQHESDSEDQITSEVTVERGDHFWAIAEKTLEDAWGRQPTTEETATYWRRVIDTNRDRLLPPHDPDLIYPGQVFQLPPIPDDPSAAEPTEPIPPITESATGQVTVEHGDNLWKIADAALTEAWGRPPTTSETTRYWHQVIEVNQDRLLPPRDPDLIFPGQVLDLPPVPHDPPVSAPEESANLGERTDGSDTVEEPVKELARPDVPPDRSAGATPTPHDQTSPSTVPPVTPPAEQPQVPETRDSANMAVEGEPGTPKPVEADDQDDSSTLLPDTGRIAGLGLLAAGIIALLDRLRRNQLRQRKPGTIPTPPPVTATRTEATLRAAAAPTATELIDLALRALAHQITHSHTPPPQVVGVHLSSDTLRLLLWSPHHDPPPGWQVDDDGHSWTLPTSIDPTHLHLLADATPAPYPALVTVGHDNDTQLLLDLEHLGAVQITGEDATATCYTMATELAASPIADILEVVCVGFGHDLEHLERITVVDKLTDILAAVEQKNTATAAQDITPFEGRLAPWGGDTWAPLIILDPSSEPPQGANQLLAAAHRGRAVCAAVGYPTGGRWRLHVTDGTVHIDPLGYTYKRRNLTPAEQADVADLTLTAKDLDGIPQTLAGEPPAPRHPADHSDADYQDDAETEVDIDSMPPSAGGKPAPEIRTLGTVHVEGLTGRFPQTKCLELVTYLAFHRHGVEADTLIEALYPDQPPNNHRLHDLMYRARRTLGTGPTGEQYLPHVTDNLYRVSPDVDCDIDRLTRHIRSADQASTEADQAEHLQTALELVEGPPFTGIKDGYGWAHTEGIITHAIVTIDNAAHRLAKHALQIGKPEQATWAARKGLTASWACEECYRNLMRAAITQDDQTALEAIYNELAAMVDADQGPDATSWLAAETIGLYEEHSRNRRRHAG
jgi:nucleoid-associated protein YgaU